VCDQVSHPYNTTGRIIFLYIIILKCWQLHKINKIIHKRNKAKINKKKLAIRKIVKVLQQRWNRYLLKPKLIPG
jgi:hypothetical protein